MNKAVGKTATEAGDKAFFAWLKAMGPIGWTIAAITVLTGLLVALAMN
jgi:hypothetical protein